MTGVAPFRSWNGARQEDVSVSLARQYGATSTFHGRSLLYACYQDVVVQSTQMRLLVHCKVQVAIVVVCLQKSPLARSICNNLGQNSTDTETELSTVIISGLPLSGSDRGPHILCSDYNMGPFIDVPNFWSSYLGELPCARPK